jgi:hypothetical protein
VWVVCTHMCRYNPGPAVMGRLAGLAARRLDEFTPQGMGNTVW